ncbi:MAG: CHAD domain-containing protein [Pyrinomonadaceae bacterium]|nr:CHAD domain-containing protein [Acidobacteriota bacterium]MBP7376812.1 CHAD domain-containing protein [Pyrinomonadaceae bacterium]
MAKAKQVPAISDAADPFRWAADVLLLRFDEVVNFGGAVTVEWNVNAVHDMRVALRRLRSALRDLSPMIDGKSIRRIKAALKKIAATLGKVRDLDVAIIAMEGLSVETRNDPNKTGIDALIAKLRIQRENGHAGIRKTFKSISVEGLRNGFLQQIEGPRCRRHLSRPADLFEVGRSVIDTRLDLLCSASNALFTPFDGARLHELRIAAKRLRYALELFESGWPDKYGGFVKEISKLQAHLGEVHDCDLWIDKLSRRLTEKDSRKMAKSPISTAAAWLLSKFVEKRGREYGKALGLWLEWTANDFVERLRTRTAAL